jgi:hypothetical protein
VAANDKGYIPAMLRIGATAEEIADIRHRDREAQGVTAEDEKLGELSVREKLTIEHEITIVKSLTPHFSTLTDRLFPNKMLLIYSDEKLTYYGQHAKEIARSFYSLVETHKAYYGGGESGFFGIAGKSLSSEELLQVKDKLISILTHLIQ